jgi:regulator of extracellular matrix RemA (YlzA/DUF370 family)
MKSLFLILFLVAIGSSASVELLISEAQLQEALESAIDDSRISSLVVDIQDDLIVLSAVMILPEQNVDLRLEIKRETDTEENCQTCCVVSATANGNPIDQSRIELWNQWIDSGMKSMVQTELGMADSVAILSDEMILIWD